MERTTVVLFGDRSVETDRYLLDVLQASKHSCLVNCFLKKTNLALAKDISRLSRRHQTVVSDFTNIQELAPRLAAGAVESNVLTSILSTIAQFVHYIGQTEENPDPNHKQSETYLAGYCTGQLSAAAVSCADTLADLVNLAVEAVRITLRLELLVNDGAYSLYPKGRNGESWCTSVRGLSADNVQSALDEFHSRESISKSNKAYISSTSSKSLTVSGAPAVLSSLFKNSQPLSSSSSFPLPVCGPYHAKHVFREEDISTVLDDIFQDSEAIAQRRRVLPLLSTHTGEPVRADTFAKVVHEILPDIIRRPMQLDLVIGYIVSRVKDNGVQRCDVLSISPTSGGNGVAAALESETETELNVMDLSTWWTDEKKGEFIASKQEAQPGIAIVGYAGRFPGADDAEGLWDVLEQGLDMHKVIPTDRFDPSTHVDPAGKRRNTSHTPYGCFINNPGHFDPQAFNMSPREAEQTDPMHRLFLVTAYEALEMSGYSPNRTHSTRADRIGTICGQTSDDYREVNAGHHVGTYFTTGTIRAFAPGRVNYFFKFSGPSYNVDTACSSSLAAIQLACTSIWSGETDTYVAGGVSVLTAPDQYAGLSRGQFLSRTGSCKTFDNTADGYCRAEAVATVILKRLDLAIADKDNIYGVIRAAATNQSAEAVSITHPHAPTQETLYRRIASQAGIDPLEIDFVEMHGTGTQAGDGIEMTSVSNVFAPGSDRVDLDRPLYVGAVKANVGHGEAASGVTALVKSLLMLRRSAIPKHAGIKGTINETFPDLEARGIRIAKETTPFVSKEGTERRMVVNNFSAAGGNTALVVEEHFQRKPSIEDPRPTHVVALSARTAESLEKITENLISFIDKNPKASLPSLSYTTTSRRMHKAIRRTFVADSLTDIKSKLKNSLNDHKTSKVGSGHVTAFAFTGQGALYTSLANQLLETSITFRSDIASFDNIATQQGFKSFLPILDGSCDDQKNLSAVQQQLGIVCVQMALARLWNLWGMSPSILIGHSLGEYAALHIAGILSISDVIFLVGTRARLLEEHCTPGTHKMLAVKGSADTVQDYLDDEGLNYEVACINAPDQIVLSGPTEDMDPVAEYLGNQNFKCSKLEVPYAFHSAQVEDILQSFEEIASKVEFHPAEVPLISPTLGKIIEEGETIDAVYLCRHAREPVNFRDGLEYASNEERIPDNTVWVEIGPHPLCLSMISGTLGRPAVSVASLNKDEMPWTTSANSLAKLWSAGLPVDWAEYHREFDEAHELLELPAPVWENENYWLQYKNDWTLLKGDPEEDDGLTPAMRWKPTTTMHKVLEEDFQEDSATVTFESDMHDQDLRNIILGHLVNGAGLCPSSVYGDMAMTAADYIHRRLRPEEETLMDVSNISVSKPVIVSTEEKVDKPLLLKIIAETNMQENEVKFKFKTGKDKAETLHATCSIFYSNGSKWKRNLMRTSYLIESRIKELEKGINDGTSQKLLRGMTYKLFGALVNYSSKFRGMSEVVSGEDGFEAYAKIRFQTTRDDGDFFCSPYWIDSIAHLSGFVLNANELTDSAKYVYISHGWESMWFLKPLQQDGQYKTYVRMDPEEENPKMMVGDLYVFDEDGPMGFIGGISFQQIPRKQLDLMLPPPGQKPAPQPRQRQQQRTQHKSTARTREQTASEKTSQRSEEKKPETKVQAKVEEKAEKKVEEKVERKVETTQETSASDSQFTQVLKIITEETGADMSALEDSQEFAELGVDSLLSLTILDCLREDGIDLSSNVFSDYPTVGALREHIQGQESSASEETQAGASSGEESSSSSPTAANESDDSASTSPATSVDEGGEGEAESSSAIAKVSQALRPIISEEMGISQDDLADDTDLVSLGLDSLMSLSILGHLKEEIGLDAQPDVLEGEPLLSELESRLSEILEPRRRSIGTATPMRKGSASGLQTPRNQRSRSGSGTATPRPKESRPKASKLANVENASEESTPSSPTSPRRKGSDSSLREQVKSAFDESEATPVKSDNTSASSDPKATSHLLQGSKFSKNTLFLLPDGSGSATSYNNLHKISPSLAVYGLNCPYLRDPENFTCGITGIASKYLDEVRRRQPTGPYVLGGWSAGGVIAYEMTRQLLEEGESVKHLILIDAPCPLTVPPMPKSLIDFFSSTGIFSGEKKDDDDQVTKPPEWLLKHFDASVRNLRSYEPKALPEGGVNTTAIWARDGVCGGKDDPKPSEDEDSEDDKKAKEWMLENRTDFGGRGWEKLIGGEEQMNGYSVGGNHFTMMREPNVGGLVQLIREANSV